MIEKATIKDAEAIQKVINAHAKKGAMLPRPIVDIYEHLRDFFVYKDKKGRVAGVCALAICWGDLAEVRSLAVDKRHSGSGIGTQLVKTCLDEAAALGISKVFTLTYIPGYFKKFGFKKVDRNSLPQKIWKDCINCPKFPDCGETPMTLDLNHK